MRTLASGQDEERKVNANHREQSRDDRLKMKQDAGYIVVLQFIFLVNGRRLSIFPYVYFFLSFRTRLHVQIPEHHKYEEPAPDPAAPPSSVPKTLQLRRCMPSANQARRGRLSLGHGGENILVSFS